MNDRRWTNGKRWGGRLALLFLLILGGVSASASVRSAATTLQSAPPVKLQFVQGTEDAPVVIEAQTFYTQSIQAPPAAPGAPAPIDQELLNKGGFFTPQVQVDNGSNLFVAYIRNDGGSAHGRLQRRTNTGQVTGSWELRLGSINGIQHKGDGISLVITGDDVLVLLSSHGTNEGPRIMALWGATVENVAVPYPDGARPTGASGASFGAVAACEVDYDRMQRMVDAAAARVVGSIPLLVRQEIQGQGVLRVGSSLDERYAILRHDARDGAYEAQRAWATTVAAYTPTPVRTPTPTR